MVIVMKFIILEDGDELDINFNKQILLYGYLAVNADIKI